MITEIKKFDELTINELYEILKLRNDIFIVEQKCLYQDVDDRDKNSYHLMIKKKDEIIAYLRILEKDVSFEEISFGRVMVKENYRGKGISRQLIQDAIDFIQNYLKEYEIRIEAQYYPINFYSSFGFVTIGDKFLSDGIEHIEMYYKK